MWESIWLESAEFAGGISIWLSIGGAVSGEVSLRYGAIFTLRSLIRSEVLDCPAARPSSRDWIGSGAGAAEASAGISGPESIGRCFRSIGVLSIEWLIPPSLPVGSRLSARSRSPQRAIASSYSALLSCCQAFEMTKAFIARSALLLGRVSSL